jgi:predicted Zn-dependent protease with MMP-like domain
MNREDDATDDATKWWMNGKPSQKIWAVYELLIHRNLIASRIAEKLELNRSTVSRHINRLAKEQHIVHSRRLADHNKRIEATSKRSVSGYSKAYIRGPRGHEADLIVAGLNAQEGVRADKPNAAPLPGGTVAMIDIHRIDINLPAIGDYQPITHLKREAWKAVKPPKKLNRGWGLWKAPAIESNVGSWNIYFRRRGVELDDEIEWGDFCMPNPVRITLPNRFWVTPEEALDDRNIRQRVDDAIWSVSATLQKMYGFRLGMPNSKRNQVFEAGALRYDPLLAQQVKDARTASGKGMLELAPGITADGSHNLLKDGFVHLDCETPSQAAFQANPVNAINHLMTEAKHAMAEMTRVADETVQTIEEHAVKSSDSILGQFEGHMLTLVERMMNSFEERFENHLGNFFTVQNERAERIMVQFQERLEGVEPDGPGHQMGLFDFFPDDADEMP